METFFRNWLVAMLPILALSAAGYVVVRKTPHSYSASAHIWVDNAVGTVQSGYNSWLSPAQTEQGTLNQLLQTLAFDRQVAHNSARYRALLAPMADPDAYVVNDLSKNVLVTPGEDRLLSISYTSKDWSLALQVVSSILSTARSASQTLSRQQTDQSIAYYTYQLQDARQRLDSSTKALADYMSLHSVSPNQLAGQITVDPTLATLYHQNQSDQTDFTTAQEQLATLHAQQASSSVGASGSFHIVDQPTVVVVSNTKQGLMNLAIAVAIGLLLSIVFVVAKTALDRGVRFADEVPELLDLPVLAAIPYSYTLASRRLGAPAAPASVEATEQRRQVG